MQRRFGSNSPVSIYGFLQYPHDIILMRVHEDVYVIVIFGRRDLMFFDDVTECRSNRRPLTFSNACVTDHVLLSEQMQR
jgi:hypothetical protein